MLEKWRKYWIGLHLKWCFHIAFECVAKMQSASDHVLRLRQTLLTEQSKANHRTNHSGRQCARNNAPIIMLIMNVSNEHEIHTA